MPQRKTKPLVTKRRRPAASASPACPIVGIGVSSSSINALKAFLQAVEPDCGIAFVLVQHLDPDHESMLAESLAAIGRVPVIPIEEGMAVASNQFYVGPSNASLTIENGRLHLAEPEEQRDFRTPIDTFLVSLARDRTKDAACVILSGTGGDGALGLRSIKGSGGLTLAQTGVRYDGMMVSALSASLVDFVLPAEDMPAKLTDYFRHMNETDRTKAPSGQRQRAEDSFNQLCALLRARTGDDFSGYKKAMIIRRVQRRMQVLQVADLAEFLDRLRRDPREIDILHQDLLIGVTSFFRDPEVFETLARDIIPRLFEGKGPNDSVRVWVPGCSSGEEAYSIAILLREYAPKLHAAPTLQIFATDIDEHALETARAGRYPIAIAKDIPAEVLEWYFLRENGAYRIISEIREICLFSRHNVLRDPPFSKVDLISCRNLLIYLSPELQTKLLPLFRYALLDHGYLLLGSSENVARHSQIFSVASRQHRIFKRKSPANREHVEFPLTTPIATNVKPSLFASLVSPRDSPQILAERFLAERYAPAYVVINAEGDVLHSSARTGKYLELPPGPPSSNIFGMAQPSLRLDLRAAVHSAIKNGQVIVQNNVVIGADDEERRINLVVQPMRRDSEEDALCLIAFEDMGDVDPLASLERFEIVGDPEGATTRQLEADLRATRDRLLTTTEELESSNEELKSGNEELLSINEELQSANEELETSREELQSINEELQTVNAELKTRVDELSQANSDIANLLEGAQIATIFLDRRFAIKRFTPAARDIFHFVESDVGRPISHIRSRLRADPALDDAERVLRTLSVFEEQVESSDGGKRYIMRMLPYRTIENVIEGVVISYIDVTKITAAEAEIISLTRELRNRVENLERLLDLVPAGIFIAGGDSPNVHVNRYGARLIGDDTDRRGPREVVTPFRLFDDDRELPFWEQPLQKAAYTGQASSTAEGRLVRRDGSSVDVMMSAAPLFDERGAPRGAIAAIVDISERKKSEARQSRLLNELRHRVKNILAVIVSLASRMSSSGASLEHFAAAFEGRLMAMGRMQELLAKDMWTRVALSDLAMTALAPYGASADDKIVIGGPAVGLPPDTAAALGMILHELATNAAKYGALSIPAGRIELSWRISDEDEGRQVLLTWTERNGPRIDAPPKMGFGARLIVQMMEYELGGQAQLSFLPEGLRCVSNFPVQDIRP